MVAREVNFAHTSVIPGFLVMEPTIPGTNNEEIPMNFILGD